MISFVWSPFRSCILLDVIELWWVMRTCKMHRQENADSINALNNALIKLFLLYGVHFISVMSTSWWLQDVLVEECRLCPAMLRITSMLHTLQDLILACHLLYHSGYSSCVLVLSPQLTRTPTMSIPSTCVINIFVPHGVHLHSIALTCGYDHSRLVVSNALWSRHCS